MVNEDTAFPVLGLGTTMEDYEEMMYVRDRRSTTLRDLIDYREDDYENELTLSDLKSNKEEHLSLSHTATAFKEAISRSQATQRIKKKAKKVDKESDFVADCIKMIRFVADSPEVNETTRADFHRHVTEGYDELLRKLEEERTNKKKERDATNTTPNNCPTVEGYGKTARVGPKKKRAKTLGYI